MIEDVVITTPLGRRCSIMSSARLHVELKAGVSRLSGGASKESRYTSGEGWVHVKVPWFCDDCVVGRGGTWRTKSGGIGGMVEDSLVRVLSR